MEINKKALDVFAGTGRRISQSKLEGYDVTALDIDKDILNNYFDPDARKIVGDSIKLIENFNNEFDLILMDNTVGLFDGYCEHFNIINNALKALKSNGKLMFNVAININDYQYRWIFKPWRYNCYIVKREVERYLNCYYKEWSNRRLLFYGKKMGSNYLIYRRFYYNYFEDRGYKIIDSGFERRYHGLYLFNYQLVRI